MDKKKSPEALNVLYAVTLQLRFTPTDCGLLKTQTLAKLSCYFAEGYIKLMRHTIDENRTTVIFKSHQVHDDP